MATTPAIARNAVQLFEPAREMVRVRCMAEDHWRDTPIVPAALGDDVGLMGTIALVLPQERATRVGQ